MGVILVACAAPPPPTVSPIRIAATDLAAPVLFAWVDGYAAAAPAVSVLPSVAPLPTVYADLTTGKTDLALAATRDPNLFATPAGYITLTVVVNAANPVISLSVAQVQAIFAGQITDWGQVGAAGGGIQTVGREPGSDAENMFETQILLGALPQANTLSAPSWEAMREAVSGDVTAIGFAPEGTPEVKAVGVSARILIVALAVSEPSGGLRDFVAWGQGQ